MQTTDTREPPAQVGRQREARQYRATAEILYGSAWQLFVAEFELVRVTESYEERYYLNGVPTARNSAMATRAAQRVTWQCFVQRLVWSDLDVMPVVDSAYPRKLSQAVCANAVAVWNGMPEHIKDRPDVKLSGVRRLERQV